MKIFLDDIKDGPSGWITYRDPKKVIVSLKSFKVSEISLDHDLGDDINIGTGMDVINWIEEQVFTNPDYIPPVIHIHSENSIKRLVMIKVAEKIAKRYAENAQCQHLNIDINYATDHTHCIDCGKVFDWKGEEVCFDGKDDS